MISRSPYDQWRAAGALKSYSAPIVPEWKTFPLIRHVRAIAWAFAAVWIAGREKRDCLDREEWIFEGIWSGWEDVQ